MNFMNFVSKTLSLVYKWSEKARADAYHYENLEGTEMEHAGESYLIDSWNGEVDS